MKKLWSLLVFLFLVCVIIYAASPYYTAYQLKTAYDNRDGVALSQYIDFEQLRPNLKTQLNQKFATTLDQYPMVAQLGGQPLTQAATQIISSSVDGAVTADNINTLIKTQGQANQATKELAAAWAIASNQVDLQQLIQQLIIHRGDMNTVVKGQIEQMMAKQAEQLEQQAASGVDTDKPKLSYCGINCFTISGYVKGYPLTIEMQRQGLVDWRIIDIQLP